MRQLRIEADLIGVTPLSFSKKIASQKEDGELHEAFENRTWMERLHVDKNGEVFIPPIALKNMLVGISGYLDEKVPGHGRANYKKHFMSGIMCIDPLMLGIKRDSKKIIKELVNGDSRGIKGGKSRVDKYFPTLMEWSTHCTFYASDPVLVDDPKTIERYLVYAGKFQGFLRWRPREGGYYGRYRVENFKATIIEE